MMMVKPAHASGTVAQPSGTNYIYVGSGSTGGDGTQPTIQQVIAETLVCNGRYTDVNAMSPCLIAATGYAYQSGWYWAGWWALHLSSTSPNSIALGAVFGGVAACPANSTGTTTCTCNDASASNPTAYVPDSTGTSCVPAPICTVTTKVADITDPVAKLYENGTYGPKQPDVAHLTPATQVGLACIQQKVAEANCYMTPQPTSGYRPTAYQTHILEVYDKWQLIKDDNTPACAETKAAIYAEWLKHKKFARRPGETSNHSQVDAQGNPAGDAVDISPVPQDIADAIACQCNMYRPMINMPDPTKNDPVHYQPRICPR